MKPPTPHQLPEALRKLLPESTARGWLGIAPALPNGAVLYGGTGITAHLLHRVSRDLDFYTSVAFDPDRLAKTLANHGSFVTTQIDGGTINGIFEDTKVRFLDASGQMAFERTTTIGGISVAGMGDLWATNLKVIGNRGALRDYFDIVAIEVAGRSVEEGLGIYRHRYGLEHKDFAVTVPVRGLLYMGDVIDDPTLANLDRY